MKREHETIAVRGHVHGSAVCSSETMHALSDPADRDQAVIQNVPFFVDAVNFGDLVRLGSPDALGVRPIEAVVLPSGCVHFVILTASLSEPDLTEHLLRLFPFPEIRFESGHDLLAVSLHPDLPPEYVLHEVFDWFERQHLPPDHDFFEITELFQSEAGPLGYPPGAP
jgi:hypothetical protein